MRTYLPYLPLALIMSAIIALSLGNHRFGKGVLSYATGMSAQSLLNDTNKERALNNVTSLTLNDELTAAAQAKANDMANRNYWSHNTPDGNAPWIFIDKAGYAYQKAGENLAYGFSSPQTTVTGWMNSLSHRQNLLDGDYTEVGFGFVNAANYQNNGAETIVVAMYGRPRPPTLTPVTPASIPLTQKAAAISTLGTSVSSAKEPPSKNVALAQIITGGRLPWINALILASGLAGLLILLTRHSLKLRRVLLSGEKFVLHHPLFDITLASFLGLCVLLVQTAGFIR